MISVCYREREELFFYYDLFAGNWIHRNLRNELLSNCLKLEMQSWTYTEGHQIISPLVDNDYSTITSKSQILRKSRSHLHLRLILSPNFFNVFSCNYFTMRIQFHANKHTINEINWDFCASFYMNAVLGFSNLYFFYISWGDNHIGGYNTVAADMYIVAIYVGLIPMSDQYNRIKSHRKHDTNHPSGSQE